jgi:Domain of unknown function (DUF4440)
MSFVLQHRQNKIPSAPGPPSHQARGPMRRFYFFGLVLLLTLATPCTAQSANQRRRETTQSEKPASDARSFMELFTNLERDWIQAVQRKDEATLESILAPEFMLRSSEEAENPQFRAAWIHQALNSYHIRTYDHRAMVIRAFLGVAVVSFVQRQQATMDGKDCSGDYLIVDLWESNHNKWQVSARYMAPISKDDIGAAKVPK